MKRIIIAGLLVVSASAQAWDSRTQYYSPGGAYLGEARTRHNPGIDASIPLQVRPMDPNAFSNGFSRGLELRRLQNEIEADRGYEMADELRQVEEEARAVDRAREALWARNRALKR